MSRPAVEVAPATPADAAWVEANLRAADAAEMRALARGPGEVLRCVERSRWALAARVDGTPACVFGLADGAGVGVPWLLGTDLVAQHRRVLVRHAPAYIGQMLAESGRLWNVVHARNLQAVRWLRRAGFTLHPEQPHPITGEPVQPFEMQQ